VLFTTMISALANRAPRRVIRASTVLSTSGRMLAPPPPLMPGMPAVVLSGRDTERRGSCFDFVLVFDVDVGVVEVGDGRGGDETTGPAIEAYIWASWMCVPGPGRYLVAGPRRVPGKAIDGSAITTEAGIGGITSVQ
jgi:hypothetical protein